MVDLLKHLDKLAGIEGYVSMKIFKSSELIDRSQCMRLKE
jgi:hypothetical protein